MTLAVSPAGVQEGQRQRRGSGPWRRPAVGGGRGRVRRRGGAFLGKPLVVAKSYSVKNPTSEENYRNSRLSKNDTMFEITSKDRILLLQSCKRRHRDANQCTPCINGVCGVLKPGGGPRGARRAGAGAPAGGRRAGRAALRRLQHRHRGGRSYYTKMTS